MAYEVWRTLAEENEGKPILEDIVDTEKEADELTWNLIYEHCCADSAWYVKKE